MSSPSLALVGASPVMQDLSDSSFDFSRLVWPQMADWLGGGQLTQVESVTATGFARQLDLLAGIDAWQVNVAQSVMRGLASRIQWGPKPYNTFTIRYRRESGGKTEFSKRLSAIRDQDALFPHYTVQAYITHRRYGQLLSAAAISTRDLYEIAAQVEQEHTDYPHSFVFSPDSDWAFSRTSNAIFLWIKWDYLRDCGARLFVCGEAVQS